MYKIKNIIFILCLLAGFSCAVDEQCRTNRSVFMGLGIYHVNKTDTSRTVIPMNIDSLTVIGLKQDTLTGKYVNMDTIYKNAKVISKINLPLHKFENISIYEISFNSKIIINKNDTLKFTNKKDTLKILHENKDKYLSLECGSIKVHFIDTAFNTHNFVDSIRIINHKVTNILKLNNTNAEHIQIYK